MWLRVSRGGRILVGEKSKCRVVEAGAEGATRTAVDDEVSQEGQGQETIPVEEILEDPAEE